MATGLSTALYWDTSIINNSCKYSLNPLDSSASDNSPISSILASLKHLSASDKLPLDESIHVSHNLSQIAPLCSSIYTYSSPKDLIAQIFELTVSISNKVHEDKTVIKSVSPILVFINVPSTDPHLAVIRFISFLTCHVPAVSIVSLYSHDSKLSIEEDPSCDHKHIHQTLKSCGISIFAPAQITSDTLESIKTFSRQSSSTFLRVIDEISESVNNLSSKTDVKPILFSRNFDYPLLNFISTLEVYHNNNHHKSISFDHIDKQSLQQNTLTKKNDIIPVDSYHTIFNLSRERVQFVTKLIGVWDFVAHDLTYDELLFAAFLIFKHAFSMNEEEYKTKMDQNGCSYSDSHWDSFQSLILSDTALYKFLIVVRDSYRPSNPYHNYRHAIDVLQASFYFLLRLCSLPQYSYTDKYNDPTIAGNDTSKIFTVLDPMEALTLLIIAIGHDVGHPGVTNMFLVNAKAPVAKLFDNKSVLESYHAAAFQRILELYWPSTQSTLVFQLIMKSVLATDMGLHFDYMDQANKILTMLNGIPMDDYLKSLDHVIRINHNKNDCETSSPEECKTTVAVTSPTTSETPNKPITTQTNIDLNTLITKVCNNSYENAKNNKLELQTLVCCLLIKCADISNVTRTLDISCKWGVVLTKEFSEVETLEIELEMKKPKELVDIKSEEEQEQIEVTEDGEGFKVPIIQLAKGQLYFINTFAKPLFVAVQQLFPQLQYTVDILEDNAKVWTDKLKSV